MEFGDRIILAFAGLALGVACGFAAGIAVCAVGGLVLPQLYPELAVLASAHLFLTIWLSTAAAGFVTGILGHWAFRPYTSLVLVGPISLLFAVFGLFAGAPMGLLLRLAGMAFGLADDADLGHAEHDILMGCAVGMGFGALAALRLMFWPPSWMPGQR